MMDGFGEIVQDGNFNIMLDILDASDVYRDNEDTGAMCILQKGGVCID